jgi:hypothetical protein
MLVINVLLILVLFFNWLFSGLMAFWPIGLLLNLGYVMKFVALGALALFLSWVFGK